MKGGGEGGKHSEITVKFTDPFTMRKTNLLLICNETSELFPK